MGIFGFMLGFVCVSIVPRVAMRARHVRFPLGYPVDVVVDRQQRIYVGLAFYGRVQVYDQEGKFLYGFFAHTNGGLFHMDIDNRNRILTIVSARGNRVFSSTLDGAIFATSRDDNDLFKTLAERSVRGFVDRVGQRYRFQHPVLWPSIDRIEEHGGRSLRIKSPVYLCLIDGPVLSIATTLLGYVLVFLVNRWREQLEQLGAGLVETRRNADGSGEREAVVDFEEGGGHGDRYNSSG